MAGNIKTTITYDELNERQQRGYALWQHAQRQNGAALVLSEETTLWFSQTDQTRAYHVELNQRNIRGKLVIVYQCGCNREDFKKHGRTDCKHIFAERVRRGETVVLSAPHKPPEKNTRATRRPARARFAADGRTIRSAHRSARRKMPTRLPELVASLKFAVDLGPTFEATPRQQRYRGGRRGADLPSRAAAIVAKVACGVSASEMMSEYDRMIDDGILLLRRAPAENTLSDWINDERLTPVLRELLRLSAYPFRRREIGAIIDSSKVSQLMTAHYKEVEYNNHDKRPNADWMKAHTLVGVETLAVMAVEFSGVYGEGTHDSNFMMPLVSSAIETFPLEFLLADKAYLSENTPQWLGDRGIKAVIPLKKNWFREGGAAYKTPLLELIEWYTQNSNRDFHEVYRLRPKIECLFSIVKRMFDGYCWSRGRKRKILNANEPCTAWINELLCKFIATNLRLTILLEEETGVSIDYRVTSRCFPAPDVPLLKSRLCVASVRGKLGRLTAHGSREEE